MMRFLLALAGAALAACGSDATPPDHATPTATVAPVTAVTAERGTGVEPPAKTATPSDVDPTRMARATVVLRVERLEELGGDKYHWERVKPLAVLKNDTATSFVDPLDVAHYGWTAGVPAGRSTIYLEPYATPPNGMWRLLDADGGKGVSHATGK